MLKSTFIAFFRSFTRHPLYALLNLLGLSLGIAVFITLGLFFRFETTYEQWLPHGDRIYMVENAWSFMAVGGEPEPWTNGSILDDIKTDYPGTIGTRVWPNDINVHVGAQVTRESERLVDTDFFRVFDLPLAAGDKATALTSPDEIVLSQPMADKYFPGTTAIGKTLRITDEQGTADYHVSGILAPIPANTEMQFDFVRLLSPTYAAGVTNWKNYGSQRLQTALRLGTPAEAARLNAQFPAFVDRHATENFAPDIPHTILHTTVSPVASLHLADAKTKTSVYVLGAVGIIAFLIAAINYVNLATARAGMRAKEVAVRKTLGATQGSLRSQFLCEALLVTLVAALIGFSLVEVSLPLINAYGNLKLKLDYQGEALALGVVAGVILLVGLLAGLYPAFVLAGFKPAQVLASSRTPAGGRLAIRTREALVVLQFAVVIAFFIMVAGFLAQLQHMKTADLGFKRDALLISDSTYDSALSNAQRDALWQAFKGVPGVLSVTAGDAAPGDDSLTNNTPVSPPGFVGHPPSMTWAIMGPDFFSTYGGTLAAGRWLDPARGDDVFFSWEGDKQKDPPVEQTRNVVINEQAVKQMGFKSASDAIGKLLKFDENTVRVAGVVRDVRFRSPKDPIPPMLYVLDLHPWYHSITGIRYAGASEPVMRARLAAAWRQVAPEVPFKAVSAVDNVDEYYKPDRNRSNLFSVGAGVAALIGCIGLYGMAAFNTSRRSREIGLRKVLGASAGKVTGLLVGQFLRPVLIANLLAWPLAWYGLKQWLGQFDDAVTISPWFFVAASVFAIAIALITVGGLAMISAGTEPGKALRHD